MEVARLPPFASDRQHFPRAYSDAMGRAGTQPFSCRLDRGVYLGTFPATWRALHQAQPSTSTLEDLCRGGQAHIHHSQAPLIPHDDVVSTSLRNERENPPQQKSSCAALRSYHSVYKQHHCHVTYIPPVSMYISALATHGYTHNAPFLFSPPPARYPAAGLMTVYRCLLCMMSRRRRGNEEGRPNTIMIHFMNQTFAGAWIFFDTPCDVH